ncbi:hypothetical protein [Amycolatopsis sp. NPDC058986]
MTDLVARPAQQIQERLLTGGRIGALTVAVTVQFVLCLPQLLASRDRFLALWPEVVAFGMLTAVAAGAVWFLVRGKEMSLVFRWTGAGVVLLASVLASAVVPPGEYLGPPHWIFGIVGWYGLVLLFDLPAPALVGFLVAHQLLTFAELVVVGPPDHLTLAPMAITAVSVGGFQLAVGLAAQVLRRAAAAAGDAAAEEERIRTQDQIAEHLHRDHHARYTTLLSTTIPLLAGLAHGSLDPADEDVRRRCAIEAARMRRLFAESDEVSDRLVHELLACVDVAERNGVLVQFAVRGEPRRLPREVRRELLDPVAAALASAVSSARTTVTRTRDRVRVSVVSDAPRPPQAGREPRHVEVNTVFDEARLWVEAIWRPTSSR